MDTLTFLMNVLKGVVSISKAVALTVAIILAAFMLRKLPDRLRKILSAAAASVLLLAVFGEIFNQHVSILTLKLILSTYLLGCIMGVAFVVTSVALSILELKPVRRAGTGALGVFSRQVCIRCCGKGDCALIFDSFSYFRRSAVILQ